RHKNRVYAYIGMYVRDTALVEDLFQDTFLKVLQSLRAGKYRDDGKFLSWVMRISHNLIIDHFRKEKQMKIVADGDYDGDIFNSRKIVESNAEDVIVKKQIRKDLRRIIDQLSEDQKEVVILRHFVNLSFKEIAEITGVSINTALGRMRYALINIRKMVDENNVVLSN
ncbi:MAG TPA: sigma-70 family RNA polymerase sigma factor, partial [Bacteroidetes bacterium]|nr:sigma-70 family RNA polymerase sigma factor [Bacteroidota bacterium]